MVRGQVQQYAPTTHCLQRTPVGLSDSHVRVGAMDRTRVGALVTFRLASVEHRRLLESAGKPQEFRSPTVRTIIPRNRRATS